MTTTIESLHVYPVKSCRGLTLGAARLTQTGLEHDRQWMLTRLDGRFVTQRELPRMALIAPALRGDALLLSAPDMPDLPLGVGADEPTRAVTVWRDSVAGIDAGDAAAAWCSDFLRTPLRLVRFAAGNHRHSSRDYTGDVPALNAFSDGFPVLIVGRASLDDLNARLPSGVGPLPMDRFRPNIVVSGLEPYDEDRLDELRVNGVRLRLVKPCTRCKITTTDQARGVALGEEPLRTLRTYRWHEALHGVIFGQNAIIVDGVNSVLSAGADIETIWR